MIYMCPACEMAYGEPKTHPDCDSEYCGREWEDVKEELMG